MQKTTYKAARGSRINNQDAEIIGRRLDELGPTCTAAQFVADAAKKSSPLRPYIEWNDKVAGKAYRLDQARYYMRSIDIEIVLADGSHQVRAWHHVMIDTEACDDGCYASSLHISQNEDLSNQVIRRALRELEGWKTRYREYSAVFSGVFAAIDQQRGKVTRRRKAKAIA